MELKPPPAWADAVPRTSLTYPLLLLRAILALLLAVSLAASEWSADTWRGQPAWASSRDGWTAVVCPAWGRLVALRAPGGEDLLRVSDKATLVEATGGAAGGHQAWLGPQSRWGWPPPAHWEYQGAERVRHDGATLVLALPAGADARLPALTRTYRWTDQGLRLALRWRSTEAFHALHVLQVRGDLAVRLVAPVSAALPAGFAVRTGPGEPMLATAIALPQPCALADGDGRVRLHRGDPFQKLFFPPQEIMVQAGRWRLAFARSDSVGTIGDEPDGGLTTQAFLGSLWDMIEIEQASPLLSGAGDLESAVLLRCEATP